MSKKIKHRNGRMLGFICAGLVLLLNALGMTSGAYARYAAAYRGDHDITLNVTPGTYAVVFHQGDTDGSESYELICKLGEQVTIPAVSEYFTREGHTGTGWNTRADGQGEEYAPGQTASDLADGGGELHLYAIWTPNIYLVNYDINGGDDAVESEKAVYGSAHVLSSQIPVREDHIFLGWFSRREEGEQLETVEVLGDITVYAHWKLDTVKITYLPNMLPQGYTHMQWIGGDGESYIKTDISLDEDSQVCVTYEMTVSASESETGVSGQNVGIFGIEGDAGFGAAMVDGQLSSRYGTESYAMPDGEGGSGKHEIYANRHIWRLDGVKAAEYTYEPFELDETALIFAAAGGSGYLKGRIYGAQFMNRDGLISSLIPAVNGAGEPGFYDIRREYFLTNAGTGEFAVGPEEKGRWEDVVRRSTAQVIDDPFERNGRHLAYWNTKSDGSGESFAVGDDIVPEEDMTLYAIWEEEYPVLSSGHTWYDRETGGEESGYTEIYIVDEISPETAAAADAVWNADDEDRGNIRCYKVGTQLWIAGDGTGVIRMAADPAGMFGGSEDSAAAHAFTNVTSIDGLDLLDSSGCETLEWLFSEKPADKSSITGTENISGMASLVDISGIEAWDVSRVKSMEGMFSGLRSLEKISDLSYWDTSNVTSLELAFAGCEAIEALDIDDWDTSKVKTIRQIFCDCTNLSGLVVGSWDTAAMTDMSYAFAGMGSGSGDFPLDLTAWTVDAAADLTGMFAGCDKIRTIYVSEIWSVDQTGDAADMFSGCSVLVGGAGTSYSSEHVGPEYARIDTAETPGYMTLSVARVVAAGNLLGFTYGGREYEVGSIYEGAEVSAVYAVPVNAENKTDIGWYELKSSITEVNVEKNFRFFKPGSLNYWFYDLQKVTSFDGMNYINTSEVTSMIYTFWKFAYNAPAFIMDLSGWDVSRVTTFKGIFYGSGYYSKKWDVGNLGGWNMSSATDLSEMFKSAAGRGYTWNAGDIGKWDVSHVTTFAYFLCEANMYASKLDIDLSAWDTSSATNMNNMFNSVAYRAKEWSVGNLKNWDTSHVTGMDYMFKSTGSYANTWYVGDISNWDTSQLNLARGMFFDVAMNVPVFELDLSGWDTHKVRNMSMMFKNTGSESEQLSIKGISDWDVSYVSNASDMFGGCGRRTPGFTLDLSGWSTPELTNTSNMFSDMISLETIYVGDGWNMASVRNSKKMFSGDSKLVGGNGTIYDKDHVDAEYARIDTEDTPGYLTSAKDKAKTLMMTASASDSTDIQQKYIETLLIYEGSLYDAATGEFMSGTSPVTGRSYASKEEWLQSDEYISWSEECEKLKSLLETA